MKNSIQLVGQRILVTGAGGGIGSAAARACATLGASLVLTDLQSPDALADELCGAGVDAAARSLDNSQPESVRRLVEEMGPFDALADCSGLYLKGDWINGGAEWVSGFRDMMNTNVLGPVNLVRECIPAMVKKGSGRVVLTGSVGARAGGSTLGAEPGYIATKGALHALVRYFARQVAAQGVVVNAVAPGPTETAMVAAAQRSWPEGALPMNRVGRPEEIGWPIAFLCSPAASYITGTVVDVNGGTFIG